jgi:4,5-DOPA dioxygenase extradiol
MASAAKTDLSKVRVLFVSHGAPSLAIDRRHPSHQFFKQLGKQLGRPKAIICISAHWEEKYVRPHIATKIYKNI